MQKKIKKIWRKFEKKENCAKVYFIAVVILVSLVIFPSIDIHN